MIRLRKKLFRVNDPVPYPPLRTQELRVNFIGKIMGGDDEPAVWGYIYESPIRCKKDIESTEFFINKGKMQKSLRTVEEFVRHEHRYYFGPCVGKRAMNEPTFFETAVKKYVFIARV